MILALITLLAAPGPGPGRHALYLLLGQWF